MRAEPLEERLLKHSIPVPWTGCWLWVGSGNAKGYGRIQTGLKSTGDRRMRSAHRVSWELFRGPILDGMHVLHRCDVPACVNPDHLFLGSNKDNMNDKAVKGRCRSNPVVGEAHPNSKLTEEQVRYILSSDKKQKDLAKELGIGKMQVSRIKRGERWRHVSGTP